jgi:hypothetical protein
VGDAFGSSGRWWLLPGQDNIARGGSAREIVRMTEQTTDLLQLRHALEAAADPEYREGSLGVAPADLGALGVRTPDLGLTGRKSGRA